MFNTFVMIMITREILRELAMNAGLQVEYSESYQLWINISFIQMWQSSQKHPFYTKFTSLDTDTFMCFLYLRIWITKYIEHTLRFLFLV
jgi:hypothetical protein